MSELLYVLVPIGVVVVVGILGSLYRARPIPFDASIKTFDHQRRAIRRRHEQLVDHRATDTQ